MHAIRFVSCDNLDMLCTAGTHLMPLLLGFCDLTILVYVYLPLCTGCKITCCAQGW